MKLPPAVAKIMASMEPESLFLLFGIGDDTIQRIRESFDRNFISLGGNDKFDTNKLEEELKIQQAQIAQVASGIGVTAAIRRVNETFSFHTTPAYAVSSKVMGEYGSMIMGAIKRSEETRHEVASIVGGVASLAGWVVASRIAAQIGRLVKALRAAQGASTGMRVARGVGAGLGALFGGGLASLGTAALGYAAGELVYQGVYRLTSNLYKERSERLAFQEIASNMFDRSRIVEDFNTYRGTMQNFSGFNGNNAYDIWNSILDRNIDGTGMKLSSLGYDYSAMAQMSASLYSSGRINDENYEGYLAKSMELGFMFGVPMEDTLSSLSRVTFGSDVSAATEAFEKLFMAVAGEGKLHASYKTIVDGLLEFTETYVQGQKFNLEYGLESLASIAQYMQPIFNRADTQAVETTVMGLDRSLASAAMGGSRFTSQLMYDSGITASEGVLGVTSNEEVFGKVLMGLIRQTGIGVQSFDAEGNLSDEKSIALYRSMTIGMGMSNQEYQVMVPVLREFVSGRRPETSDGGGFLGIYNRELANKAGVGSIFDFISEIGEGSRRLTEKVFLNADIMNSLDDSIMRFYGEKVPLIISTIGRLGVVVSGLITGNFRADPGRGYGISPMGAAGATATRPSIPTAISGLGSFRYVDARFANLSETERGFLTALVSRIGGYNAVTLTGVGGLAYDVAAYAGTINYGTDIVIGGAADVFFPFNRGVVVFAGDRYNSRGENTYGKSVVIQLDDSRTVSFSHLSRITVSVGQTVSYGQRVGVQGATGTKLTGAHVDIEFRVRGSIVSHQGDLAREFGGLLYSPPQYDIPDDGVRYNDGNDDSGSSNSVEINIEAGYYNPGQLSLYVANRISVV